MVVYGDSREECEWCTNEQSRNRRENEDDTDERLCYRHCSETEDGQHVADPSTLALTYDHGTPYLDVSCQYCGLSTGVPIDLNDLTWE